MRERVKVSFEEIKRCLTWQEILQLSFRVSGKGMAEVAYECGWRDGGKVLGRILRNTEGDDQRYMPHAMLVPFLVACGTAAPVWWLLFQLELDPKDDPRFDMGANFMMQLGQEQRECHRLLREILTVVRSGDSLEVPVDVQAQFCLVDREVLPDWLLAEGKEIAGQLAAWEATR